eukprot:CAMPEP_0182883252 /NCGR_PEP_ID=MMETSP0034_2-20130328/18274_1 /TAXON_ID=156128 /ORGANISM="Nephroselmis pyriformis, Strain CCMP717" /LENGTH=50 /DNA_ID=CAMNT_0025016385 /DNA_START=185 /DNA_END=334 /DNA_ORIENTATION=+
MTPSGSAESISGMAAAVGSVTSRSSPPLPGALGGAPKHSVQAVEGAKHVE